MPNAAIPDLRKNLCASRAQAQQNTLRQSGGLISVALFGSILNTSDFTGRMETAPSVTTVAALIGTGIAAVSGERAARQGTPDAGGDSLTTASPAATNTTSPQGRS
ncbi:hypothetical protein ACWCWD_36915 [Streptomyces sp. NPDC001493]